MNPSELLNPSRSELSFCKESEAIHQLFDRAFSRMESQIQSYSREEIGEADLQAAWIPFAQEFKTFCEGVYGRLVGVGTPDYEEIKYEGEGISAFYRHETTMEGYDDGYWMVLRSPVGNIELRAKKGEGEMFSGTKKRSIKIMIRQGLLSSMTHTIMIERENADWGGRPHETTIKTLSF